MLKIHKPFSKHELLLIPITSICIISGLLGFYCLTYTPELSHAETVTYEPPEVHPNLSDITYMQDITQETCANTREADADGNYQYQLIDKRDNKTYWVAKLKDGNCWMTQNLDLDIPAEGLKAEDTDITEDWNNKSVFKPVATQTGTPSGFTGTYNIKVSYDPGEYVYSMPSEHVNCGSITQLSQCTSWFRVPGLSRNESRDEQAHYLAGNYYASLAARAGSNNGSICPKGWKLPTSGPAHNDNNKSFYNLLSKYGLASSITSVVGDTRYSLITPPFYLVYGGNIANVSIDNSGIAGRYWSSVVSGGSLGYLMSFDIANINPSNSASVGNGYNVRCLALSGSAEKDDNINITITPTISLDVTNEAEVKKSDTNPSTAAFSALVASNQPYNVSISSVDPIMKSPATNTTIPSKSGLLNANENAWGIKSSTASTYTQITTSPKTFYTSSSPESKNLLFNIGISTTEDLPSGEYSTDITITATQN